MGLWLEIQDSLNRKKQNISKLRRKIYTDYIGFSVTGLQYKVAVLNRKIKAINSEEYGPSSRGHSCDSVHKRLKNWYFF